MTNASAQRPVDRLFRALCALCAMLPLACGVWFVLATLVRGLPGLLHLLTAPDLALWEVWIHVRLVGVAAAIAIPVGIGAAVCLEHVAAPGLFTTIARRSISLLATVPSVLYGLCGLTFLVVCLGIRSDFATQACCLALCLFPIVVERTRNALRTVSPLMHEASFALGADPLRALRHVLLPLALPALASEMLVVLARALGTVAPLLVVDAFKALPPPRKVDFDLVPLSVRVFRSGTNPDPRHQAWAATAVLALLAILVVLHLAANWLSKRRSTEVRHVHRDGLSERGAA